MRIFLLLTLVFPSLAFAGLVEVNSSQYLRESGNPQAQYLEVTLDNAGEIRVSNVNLQDGYIELAASTDVLLNGSSLMQPFSLPTGGSAVFPLEAGTHYLEVTLRGKPGGGLKVSFYEDKPDAPVQGKGWELLDDGTVLHRETGLIWHRKLSSPGIERARYSYDRVVPDQSALDGVMTISEYIDALNQGQFGTSTDNGNAGHTDWRAPSIEELMSVLDVRAVPPFSDASGSVREQESALYAGMSPGEPLFVCLTPFEDGPYLGPETPLCEDEWAVWGLITNDRAQGVTGPAGFNYFYGVDLYDARLVDSVKQTGSVWPVRGGTPE